MARTFFIAAVFLAAFMITACQTQRIWISSPGHQTLNGGPYDIVLEPLKQEADFFNWFRLTVKNKTTLDMEVDWNRTRYIHNGKEAGPFVFAGVVPESVRNGTVPGALIPAGTTFVRDIIPFKLIAFTPLRDQTIDTEQRNILPGLIPEGENGVSLIILQNGKRARARVSVNIEARKIE